MTIFNEDLKVIIVDQTDERLGRQIVHDPRSRNYEHEPLRLDDNLRDLQWRHRVYGPREVPRQRVGCCTGVDQCVRGNALGNRKRGVVLDMACAESLYSRASQLDPWAGQWPPTDTGSSGLAACKAAKEQGLITRYEWLFSPEAVLAALREIPVGFGGMWTNDMFDPDPRTLLVEPTGGPAGGHQWSLIGWSREFQAFEGLCWWGESFGDRGRFRIRYDHFADLMADNGDAHVSYRAV